MSNPLAVVREFHDAYRAGDWETTMRLQSEGAVVVVHGGSEAGTYRGHDEIRGYFRRWLGTWVEYTFEIEEMVPQRDRVLIVGRESARGRGSGVAVESSTVTVHTVRDGLITRTETGAANTAELEALTAQFSS